MKTLVTLIIVFFAATSFAQFERGLINRVDRQVGQSSARIDHQVVKTPYAVATAQQKSFEVTLDHQDIKMGLLDYGWISGTLKNLTENPIQLVFYRTQNRETNDSTGWTTGICFGQLCYSIYKDELSFDEAYELPGGGQTEFKLAISNFLSYDDSILVHVLLAALGTTTDDTVGLWMTAKAQKPSAVADQPAAKRSTIRSIFPSPLMGGNSINVSVESVREASYRYNIYDPFGREVAFGTSQRKLIAGTSQFSIGSLEGLGSGSYLLKLSFSDGSSDAFPFTVLR